jgi:hypothetical protein
MTAEPRLHHQLELLGLESARQMAELAPSRAAATRYRNLIDSAHELRSDLPAADDLSFQHSGLCQTCLPHRKPKSNAAVWKRESGRFKLYVRPGIATGRDAADGEDYVGVPYHGACIPTDLWARAVASAS